MTSRPCVDGADAPFLSLDCGRLDQRDARRRRIASRCCRGTRACTAARIQIAAHRPPPRGRPCRDPAPRGPRGTGRRGDHLPQHDRGDQPPGLPARAEPRRRGRHDGRRAPRQPVAVDAGGTLPGRRVRARRHVHTGRRRGGAGRRPGQSCSRSPGRRTYGLDAAVEPILAAAHERGVPVLVDAAQLAPHRPLPADADFLAFSGHTMYAPFGAGALIGPRAAIATATLSSPAAARGARRIRRGRLGLPARARGGRLPERAGRDGVRGRRGRARGGRLARREAHDRALARSLRDGSRPRPGARPEPGPEGRAPAGRLVRRRRGAARARRRAAERGVRDRRAAWLLYAHPYVTRLLGLGEVSEHSRARAAARRHDRGALPRRRARLGGPRDDARGRRAGAATVRAIARQRRRRRPPSKTPSPAITGLPACRAPLRS